MRHLNFLIAGLLFLSCIELVAQAPFPGKAEIKQFESSTTCVVLEDNAFSFYNAFIREAVNAFWKITPYEFIDTEEFNLRRSDPKYSFIVLTQTSYEKDKSNGLFNFLNLLQGKDIDALGEMPEICAIPLSFAGEDGDEGDYSYKLGAILAFMQKHAMMILADPSLTGRRYLRFYNRFIPDVRNRTILVKEEDLSPGISSIEKIKAIYGGKIEIVSEEKIIEAIDNKAPSTVILHKVGPAGQNGGYCFKMLIGTDDANMYYYNQHVTSNTSPDGLLAADLKRLAD